MAKAVLLNDALAEYERSRRATDYSASTIKSDLQVVRALLAVTGNIYTRTLDQRHMDMYFEWSKTRHKDSTRDLYLSKLRHFFEWCRQRGYMDSNLLRDRRVIVDRTVDTRLFVQADDFPRLLDAARHPRDRILIALGLYLFLRGGEIADLRVGDVDLDAGLIDTRQFKTRSSDVMPIWAELDAELRIWLTWYAKHNGPLLDDYYLIPRKRNYSNDRRIPGHGRFEVCEDKSNLAVDPTKKCARPHDIVKRALADCDFPLVAGEGCHTLRRSGARALYEVLRKEQSDTGALQEVKSYLHHKHQEMTEHYLGVKPERERRNARAKGRGLMLPRPTIAGDNVIPLRKGSDSGH
jgi:integrase